MLAFDMTPWEAVRVHMILAIQNTLKAVARIWEGAEIIVVVAPRGMENVFGTLRRWGIQNATCALVGAGASGADPLVGAGVGLLCSEL